MYRYNFEIISVDRNLLCQESFYPCLIDKFIYFKIQLIEGKSVSNLRVYENP